MPRRVILISGDPNHGKSFLGEALRDQHNFHLLATDALYVEFVEKSFPRLFLPDLGNVIAQHYHYILALDRARVVAWHDYLFAQIVTASDQHERVAVEGYLLKDCKERFEAELRSRGRDVFRIRMENRVPLRESPAMTVADVADLGT